MPNIPGNKVLAGTHGFLWWQGEPILEFTKITFKVTANRDDIQLGMDVDSKLVGLKGEWSMTVKKVYSRYEDVRVAFNQGKDPRGQFITKLADPDANGQQEERYSVDNCWFNDLPVVGYEKGANIEQEFTGGFTPSDMINLDRIKV